MLLPLVLYLDSKLFLIEIRRVFLNCDLEEEIYMNQPIGFTPEGQEDKLCHLKRSICRLVLPVKFYEAIISFVLFMVLEYYYVYVKRTKGIMFLLRMLMIYY